MKAVRSRNTEIVEKLVGHGAKVSAVDKVKPILYNYIDLKSENYEIKTTFPLIISPCRRETLRYILLYEEEASESQKFCYVTQRTHVYCINLTKLEKLHTIWILPIIKVYCHRYSEQVS